MYLPPFPILGGLLAWGTVYFLGFKKQKWAELILGGVAFLLAMVIQNPIQQFPLLGMGIRSNADVIARGTAFTLGVAIWVGIVAGFVQEGVKYLLVKDKGTRTALFVGLGFGITEVLFVAVTPIIAVAATGGKIDVPVFQALLSMVERYFAVLFHVGTTVYLAYAARNGFGKKGYLEMTVLHGFVDTLAAYGQLLFLESKELAMKFTTGLEVIFAVISIALIVYTLPFARIKEPEEETVIW
ncbi:YhfC family glutamic-type intramembrane protease [Thermococcus sp. Bubb.Bath]|uniref:YhfC family glutamic-type intramembrane protease n=1 Tax=Thermococcus sp. Bubb.Bath TaxID=1638242 RepID=UPI00143C14B9|nr:YhfC family glutamic-type intramembrane protease [Thermococcus sp. Bubb.Bath]NJF24786.1 YhfC family intramembrane metalloprotease [Thermococcus sp. Bubb.Bath]